MDGRAPSVPWEYSCCQGYIPKCCCCDFPNWGKGNHSCLYLEGCCCPILSLSITRIFLMDKLQIQPDPGDYQLIQFSNCMQMLSCICHVAAFVYPQMQDLAQIVDCIADIVTYSVAGCMGVQINTELKVRRHCCPSAAVARSRSRLTYLSCRCRAKPSTRTAWRMRVLALTQSHSTVCLSQRQRQRTEPRQMKRWIVEGGLRGSGTSKCCLNVDLRFAGQCFCRTLECSTSLRGGQLLSGACTRRRNRDMGIRDDSDALFSILRPSECGVFLRPRRL